jgi:Lrp/AsnC family leucine-responsive transcriptional regulator
MPLDKKDIAIIDILKQNSRMSIRDIAKKTNLRPSTVHQRITKLKKENVIEKFTLKLDNKKVDENFIVFILVKTKPNVILDNKIIQNKHVKEIFGLTGEHDLLLKLKFKDIEEFNDFVIKFRKEQQVEATLTMVATANVKEELN